VSQVEQLVEQFVDQVPAWRGLALEVRPLPGGITNQNFVVRAGGREYVVRLPGARTELLGIDRRHEAEAAQRAAELGVGPPVLGHLPATGTLITELVAGRHLAADDITSRLGELVAMLQRFHRSGPLRGAFPIHRVVEWHARDATAHGVVPPPTWAWLHDQSLRIEAAFRSSPQPPVPCHNDLLPANVLVGRDRMWLLDFEYAGMNDRFFDLGNLSVNCGLDRSGDEGLLWSYFGRADRASWARLQLMKVMSELREGMWAVVQQAISSLDTDFATYAGERLQSCERLARTPEFETWLADAAEAPEP
jgi:thiamine kinase-like enzyme